MFHFCFQNLLLARFMMSLFEEISKIEIFLLLSISIKFKERIILSEKNYCFSKRVKSTYLQLYIFDFNETSFQE